MQSFYNLQKLLPIFLLLPPICSSVWWFQKLKIPISIAFQFGIDAFAIDKAVLNLKLHKPIKFQGFSYISDICFQTRQPVFVQLLSAGFRVSQCHFVTLSVDQRVNVENCIRTLSEVAKARAIAIPSDLDMKVSQNAFYFRGKHEILSRYFYFTYVSIISHIVNLRFCISGKSQIVGFGRARFQIYFAS